MFLWRNGENYLGIITKYSSLTSPRFSIKTMGTILFLEKQSKKKYINKSNQKKKKEGIPYLTYLFFSDMKRYLAFHVRKK